MKKSERYIKKIKLFVLVILCCFIIFSMFQKKNDYVNINILNNINMEVPNRANMNEYKRLNDKKPAFSKMKLLDFINMTKNNKVKNGVYYIGNPTCYSCQNVVPILNYVLKEKKLYAYYINVHDSKYNGKDNLNDELKYYLRNFLEDKTVMYIPVVFIIDNNKVVKYCDNIDQRLLQGKITQQTLNSYRDIVSIKND